MSAIASAGGSRARGFAELAARALRDIRWPQVRGAMLFGLATSVTTGVVFWGPFSQLVQTMPASMLLANVLIGDQIRVLCLLAALVIADRAVDEGASRRAAYVAAACLGCVAGVALSEPLHWAWRTYALPAAWPTDRPWLHGTAALFYWPIFDFTQWSLTGGSVVFLYAGRRAARRTAQLLHAGELDRVRRSKLALESRLQAMQARVEPRFLLNTLAQVERLYAIDAARAARMLDDLIAYLRAAMPLMRDTASTVAQEIDLARAYLDIVRIRLGDRLSFAIEVPPDLGDLRMPPMMLLPLIDQAIVHGFELTQAGGAIRIDAQVRAGRLRLTITDSGVGLVPEAGGDGIRDIRDRLAALYGDNARLELGRTGADTTEAVLELPLEARGALERDLRRAGAEEAPG
jgi:hypothetical protein